MTTRLNFIAERGHILVPLESGHALIDTGSPFSLASGSFEFAGFSFDPPDDFMGLSVDSLSDLAGFRIDILIGCDILSQFTIRIRWHDRCIDIGDDLADGEIVCGMSALAGTPVFPISIGNADTRAIFDTGAHLSYITPECVAGMESFGKKDDFSPFIGHFTVSTYRLPTRLGSQVHGHEYGVLSDTMQAMVGMAMLLSGASAVIGTALLEHYDCTIAWKKGVISWQSRNTCLH